MLKWCPCMGWCLTDPASGGEAKVLLNSMTTPAYNVRRISSFGQTVINDAGEEEEVCRHGTLPTSSENGPPWTANTVPVQPGVTKSDIAVRIQRMTSIPEASSPKSKNRLKKSLSESDHCVVDSPLRTRKKIHTPEEFAEITFHQNNESDVCSVKSETYSERIRCYEERRSYDKPDLPQIVSKLEPKDGKTAPSGPVFGLVKTNENSNTLYRPNSPKLQWMKKLSTQKNKSPVEIPKFSREKSKESVNEKSKGVHCNDDEMRVENPITPRYLSTSKDDIGFDDNDDDFDTISHSLSQSTVPIGDDDLEEVLFDANRSFDSVELAKHYGLDLSLYDLNDGVGLGGSRENDLSSSQGIAKITFSSHFDKEKNLLVVTIEKVEGLGGHGKNNLPFDVIVKLGMLKGGHVYSTKASPSDKSINQSFSLHVKDLAAAVLRLSLYNSAWQGSHDALGYSLFRVNKSSHSAARHTINVSPKSNLTESAGLIEVSVRYQSNILYVIIHKLFDILPAYRGFKLYAKVALFVSSKKHKEKISKTESGEKGYIMYDFEAKFKAENPSEQHTFVIINLKKKGENNKLFKHDKTLGRIILGPLFYTGKELNLWGQTILEEKITTHTYSLYL